MELFSESKRKDEFKIIDHFLLGRITVIQIYGRPWYKLNTLIYKFGLDSFKQIKNKIFIENDVRVVLIEDSTKEDDYVIFVSEHLLYQLLLNTDNEVSGVFKNWLSRSMLPMIKALDACSNISDLSESISESFRSLYESIYFGIDEFQHDFDGDKLKINFNEFITFPSESDKRKPSSSTTWWHNKEYIEKHVSRYNIEDLYKYYIDNQAQDDELYNEIFK